MGSTSEVRLDFRTRLCLFPERAKHFALSGLKDSICLIRRALPYVIMFCPFRAITTLGAIAIRI